MENLYDYAPTEYSAEIDSFNFQSNSFNLTSKPPNKIVEQTLDRLESYYKLSRFTVPVDFLEDSHIDRIINLIEREKYDKTPGSTFIREGLTTNLMVIESLGKVGLRETVKERLEELLNDELDHRWVADPVRVFVKFEPHSNKKVQQKRWRLIWGVSLVDQIIDRLLYQDLCENSIQHASEQSAKVGFSFMKGGVQQLIQDYDDGKDNWISFDASQFDFTVAGWHLEMVAQLNKRLKNDSIIIKDALWDKLMLAREKAVAYGKFCFSDGQQFIKILPGMQLSGRYTTIDANSKIMILIRVMNDVVNGRPSSEKDIIAMGDDSVQNNIPDVDKFVNEIRDIHGIKLTIESVKGKLVDQNFCSMDFIKTPENTYVFVPRNLEKNIFALINMEHKKQKYLGDTLVNLCQQYAYHPIYKPLKQLLDKNYPEKTHSDKWFQNKITGYESTWWF